MTTDGFFNVSLSAGNVLNTPFDGTPRQFLNVSFFLAVEYPVANWKNNSPTQMIYSNGSVLNSKNDVESTI